MELLLVLQLTGAVLTLVLITLAAVRLPRAVRAWSSVVVGGTLIAGLYATEANLLGHPKPARLESGVLEAEVLAIHMIEGQAIHVWLLEEASEEPLALSIPWDETTARAAQAAQRQAEDNGTRVGVRLGGRPISQDDEPVFYAEPQPAPPPKRSERRGPGF